ncbi:unnamed protein product, partial [Ambrosiozyma monospora]
MPALIMNRVIAYIEISDIKTIGVICLSAFMMYVINACVAFIITYATPIPKSKNNRWVGGAILAGIMQNVSDLPIAYLQATPMFTDDQINKGTAYVIIWLAMYIVAQFNCGLFRLVETDFKPVPPDLESGEKSDQKQDNSTDNHSDDSTETANHEKKEEKDITQNTTKLQQTPPQQTAQPPSIV